MVDSGLILGRLRCCYTRTKKRESILFFPLATPVFANFLVYEGRQQRRHIKAERESIFFELLQLVLLYPDSQHCLVLVSLVRCHVCSVSWLRTQSSTVWLHLSSLNCKIFSSRSFVRFITARKINHLRIQKFFLKMQKKGG